MIIITIETINIKSMFSLKRIRESIAPKNGAVLKNALVRAEPRSLRERTKSMMLNP